MSILLIRFGWFSVVVVVVVDDVGIKMVWSRFVCFGWLYDLFGS